MSILFIRHSESGANAADAKSGHTIQALPPKKITSPAEARLLDERKKRFSQFYITHIIASGYIRTQETAAPTVARFPNAKYMIWEEANELNYLSDKSYEEDRKGNVKSYWERCDPDYWDGESRDGTETFSQFIERVKNLVARLEATFSEKDNVAVFTHGQVMHMVRLLEKYPIANDQTLMRKFKEVAIGKDSTSPIPNAHAFFLGAANAPLLDMATPTYSKAIMDFTNKHNAVLEEEVHRLWTTKVHGTTPDNSGNQHLGGKQSHTRGKE